VKKSEVVEYHNPGGTLFAQIGCPDDEMRSGKLMEKFRCIGQKVGYFLELFFYRSKSRLKI
jgi:hypothetical protein